MNEKIYERTRYKNENVENVDTSFQQTKGEKYYESFLMQLFRIVSLYNFFFIFKN